MSKITDYEEYEKKYITKDVFNSMLQKNTSLSAGSIGSIMFDRYLFSKGWVVINGAVRNAYHPNAGFFNEATGEIIWVDYGLKINKKEYPFYIASGSRFYHVPQSQEDINFFENGMLRPITNEN